MIRVSALLALAAMSLAAGGCRGTRPVSQTATPDTTPPLFVDAAESSGIRCTHSNGAAGRKNFVEITGSGCAFLDYDRDGRPDVLLLDAGPLPGGSGAQRNGLFHNMGGGRFVDVTESSGLAHTGYTQGVAVGDYDGDGYPDLYLTAYGGNRLFRNIHGSGKFEDTTTRAGVGDLDGGKRYSLSAAWGDFDRDGRLDLFVTHYARWSFETNQPCLDALHTLGYCSPEKYEGDVCRLYRNNGNGTFVDVTHATGADQAKGRAMGVVWLDFDGDGWEDLFVTCDLQPNLLLRNGAGKHFREVGMNAGVAVGEMGAPLSGMGIAAGDYDNDGREDLHVTNFSHQPNSLYRNEGRGLFENASVASGIAEPSNAPLGWGCAFLDYDNDGYQDLAVANGHIQNNIEQLVPGLTYRQAKSLYHNDRNGRFEPVLRGLGDLAQPTVSRGLAVADFDGDGRPDLLVNNQNGKAQLFRNAAPNTGHWIFLTLEGTRSNREGLQARILLQAGKLRQLREVRAGSSFCSSSDPSAHFGLGASVVADRVEVRWPSGVISRTEHLPGDRSWLWREGEKAARPLVPGRNDPHD